jgi:hypothetical protein
MSRRRVEPFVPVDNANKLARDEMQLLSLSV